jgi:phosphoserine phosphatase
VNLETSYMHDQITFDFGEKGRMLLAMLQKLDKTQVQEVLDSIEYLPTSTSRETVSEVFETLALLTGAVVLSQARMF